MHITDISLLRKSVYHRSSLFQNNIYYCKNIHSPSLSLSLCPTENNTTAMNTMLIRFLQCCVGIFLLFQCLHFDDSNYHHVQAFTNPSIIITTTSTKTKTTKTTVIPFTTLNNNNNNNNIIIMNNMKSSSITQHQPFTATTSSSTLLRMSESSSSSENKKLPFWFDPNTKGGALVLMVVLFVVPILLYNVLISDIVGMDDIEAGIDIGIGFTIVSCLAWVSTYVFRVATKDMTYAKQLKDYENAVIAKRLEELDDDEVQALVEEVERDSF